MWKTHDLKITWLMGMTQALRSVPGLTMKESNLLSLFPFSLHTKTCPCITASPELINYHKSFLVYIYYGTNIRLLNKILLLYLPHKIDYFYK